MEKEGGILRGDFLLASYMVVVAAAVTFELKDNEPQAWNLT